MLAGIEDFVGWYRLDAFAYRLLLSVNGAEYVAFAEEQFVVHLPDLTVSAIIADRRIGGETSWRGATPVTGPGL